MLIISNIDTEQALDNMTPLCGLAGTWAKVKKILCVLWIDTRPTYKMPTTKHYGSFYGIPDFFF